MDWKIEYKEDISFPNRSVSLTEFYQNPSKMFCRYRKAYSKAYLERQKGTKQAKKTFEKKE